MRFLRLSVGEHETDSPLEPTELDQPAAETNGDHTARSAGVVLVGCVKSKLPEPAAARDLYTSPLFVKARRYAEGTGRPWFILSAEHGLVQPHEWVAPYDRYLPDTLDSYRQVWGAWVVARLELLLGDIKGRVIEVHAGRAYVEAIRPHLQSRGARLIEPLAGLTMGERLGWYESAGTGSHPAAPTQDAQHEDASDLSADHRGGSDVVDGPEEIGSFSHKWPEETENFGRGWQVVVRDRAGKTRRVRHGLSMRQIYGKHRAHSVTFLDGVPMVEGVAADDYDDSRCLVSPLKHTDRTLVRRPEAVPAPYAGLPLTDHRQEIDAPYSRDGVAVKLREDDVLGWAVYALAREEVLATESGQQVAAPTPPLPVGRRAGGVEEVVDALLTLGRSTVGEPHDSPSFTPHHEANHLVLNDPFAFLLGVIFDQNINAERAWRAPYDLRERLGHLDPHRIAYDLDAVKRAVDTPPKLHRYVERLPDWITGAARRVLELYGGSAGAIWGDRPTARELILRLDDFPGIGQKKAAMAVELLERDLGVPIEEMSGSDIAYDVHVRRVFLRTGLAQVDDLDHMVAVARQAHPERPGEIDYPAWLVGRPWCHAGVPDCPACVLRLVCPKRVAAADDVHG